MGEDDYPYLKALDEEGLIKELYKQSLIARDASAAVEACLDELRRRGDA